MGAIDVGKETLGPLNRFDSVMMSHKTYVQYCKFGDIYDWSGPRYSLTDFKIFGEIVVSTIA